MLRGAASGFLGLAITSVAHGQCPPTIVRQPAEAGGCIGTEILFEVRAIGDGPLRYQWWQEGRHGSRRLPDDGHFRGVDSPALRISQGTLLDRQATYWCVISSACEPVETVRVGCTPGCITDFDDGTGACGPGGIDDLLYYLVILYDQGSPLADVDDGSFTESPDEGVTIDDLLYFLFRFENGC